MIKQVPIEVGIENFPAEVDMGGSLYKLDRINRVSDNKTKTSALLIVYKEKR